MLRPRQEQAVPAAAVLGNSDARTTRRRSPTSVSDQVASTHITLTQGVTRDILALGGERKCTICAARGSDVWLSAPLGDLSNPEEYQQFLSFIETFRAEHRFDDFLFAHDLHPCYLSTQYAQRQPQPTIAVQHHHAHAVSCAVDAGASLPVIGVVCDGAGYGTDGTSWGAEVLLCEADSFQRLAHLDPFALPGGDLAARFTWRPALALLRATFPRNPHKLDLPALRRVDAAQLRMVLQQLDVGLNTPNTTSLGRMFDAVAFLVGVGEENTFEGQAAIELQTLATPVWDPTDATVAAYPFALRHSGEAPTRIDWQPMIRAVVGDLLGGIESRIVAARFHSTIVAMLADAVDVAVRRSGIQKVALSGGCFANELLRTGLEQALLRRGLTVLLHDRISCGDAGLSLGQAIIASTMASQGRRADRGVESCA